MQPFRLQSTAFSDEAEIPKKYTGEGLDKSPPLDWSGVPPAARELALICDDPDAPTPEPWVHWLIYSLPATISSLPEGIPAKDRLETPVASIQGTNSWNKIGYGGPMPPPGHGWHRYIFRLYALDKKLSLGPGATKEQLLRAIKGHILREAQLIGKYQR